MKITLAAIRSAGARRNPIEPLVLDYVQRMTPTADGSPADFPSEERFLAWLSREVVGGAVYAVLLDSRGQQHSSEQLASAIGRQRDSGKRHLVFAIGPPDGWSSAALSVASLKLSFGPMTLPHELARLVLAEQLYRALTILAGHPYHSGH
jgi:23S rRNA (pseudouridine1915-N3)-methyltransferase